MDPQGTLEAYARAWAESDECKIQRWLEDCWTPTSTYVSPLTDVVQGIDALTRLIMDYPVMFPDAEIRPSGRTSVHHRYACCDWQLSSSARIRAVGHDYGYAMTGMDVVEFCDAGAVGSVVSFILGPP
jgi:hypothetical protein